METHIQHDHSPHALDAPTGAAEMNYFLPQDLRDVLLEYMEQREDIQDGEDGRQLPNEEMSLAAQLRDLKPLREVA